MRGLRTANLVVAFVATTAPTAHVLEMPSKLTLDAALWLGIQQQLYRGWGALFGPVEILAFGSSLLLLWVSRRRPDERRVYLVATVCYAAMLLCFFVFDAPVNAALSDWTVQTMPTTWPAFRLRWEIGHAFAAVFSITAFVGLVRQGIRRADVDIDDASF